MVSLIDLPKYSETKRSFCKKKLRSKQLWTFLFSMGDISYIKNKNLGQKKILEPKIEKKNERNPNQKNLY